MPDGVALALAKLAPVIFGGDGRGIMNVCDLASYVAPRIAPPMPRA